MQEQEKELRLALICFGGISLAVYMHGVSKEILKLVRASRRLHSIHDRNARLAAGFFDAADAKDPEYDTEAVYFELLREIGRIVDLRVVVDIIAGASAGGINGTMLARALAHDLPMGSLRDLWLEQADVSQLLAGEARAKAWSKWFLVPFIWSLAKLKLILPEQDPEVRRKLSLFVRSRWFKPPLDGLRMSALMYDAIAGMGEAASPTASLLPLGQDLDLYVTLTDFYGYRQVMQIHSPPLVGEVEHRHVLHFNCRHWPDGPVETEFDLAHAPALAFAARATSSFPGAFPPAEIAEMDRLLADRRIAWPGRAEFLARHFEAYGKAGENPATSSFIDGSVLINKPFREAMGAIAGRPAHRQVDRRLVYIDPDPLKFGSAKPTRAPGFFSALRGALSDIPRNEPIGDELAALDAYNERVRRRRAIIDASRPRIARLVDAIARLPRDRAATAEEIRAWREAVNARVIRDAGFAYDGYVRLKLASVLSFVAQLIAGLCDAPERSPVARAADEIIQAWAESRAIEPELVSGAPVEGAGASDAAPPRWVAFLLAFDLDYRLRRLHFMIQGQNRLYRLRDAPGWDGIETATIDGLKRELYRVLVSLRRRESPAFVSDATRTMAQQLFGVAPSAEESRRPGDYARAFVQDHGTEIDALVRALAREIGLDATTQELDRLLATMEPGVWSDAARREVLVNYLGFPFWDLLTFSITSWRDSSEYDEILVDRISPEDARAVMPGGEPCRLKGVEFGHFGAFLSRAYREHDYLWGRLNGIDRLIDIVCDAAGIDAANPAPGAPGAPDIAALKKRAFTIVLDAEAPHLPHSTDLIATLRREIEKLG
jgi:patatin-related protein